MIAVPIIPFWVKALVLVALLAGFGWLAMDYGYDRRDLEVKTEQLLAIEAAATREAEVRTELSGVSQQLQDALRDVKVEVVYVDRITRKEIEKPVYEACELPETGRLLLRETATRLNDIREGSP